MQRIKVVLRKKITARLKRKPEIKVGKRRQRYLFWYISTLQQTIPQSWTVSRRQQINSDIKLM